MDRSRLKRAAVVSPGDELVNPALHLHAVVRDASALTQVDPGSRGKSVYEATRY